MKTFRAFFISLTLFSSFATAAVEYPADVSFPLQCQTNSDSFTILNARTYVRDNTTYKNSCMYYTYGDEQNFFCVTRSPVRGSMNVDFDQYTTFEKDGVRYRSYPFTYSTIWIDYGSCVAVEKN